MTPPYPKSYAAHHITGAASTLLSSGPTTLHSVVVNTGATGGTVTVYDGLDDTGTELCAIDGTAPRDLTYDISCAVGLFVVTVGSGIDVTVTHP